MKRLLAIFGGLVLALAISPVAAQAATDGFSVNDGRIYDANGNQFIPQGINHGHAWYSSETTSFADIRAAGANTVRVVLSGGRYGTNSTTDVSNVIEMCKQSQLVCILENHDTTGYGEDGSATSLAAAAQYWTSVKSALIGQEKFAMINIGNEPFGNIGYESWTEDTIAAIETLRSAGLTHTIVVDAPNWGQDWSFTMRDNAGSVAATDSNTVFSVHMYGVFDTAPEVKAYLDSFTSRGLPIMVGEFGDNHSDGNPDEATILSYTRSHGIGMLGWSWSGNGSGVEYLDIVNDFDAASLTPWGERFVNGVDGLKARSAQPATVYSSGGSDMAPNGYPYCNSASSDADGDGWGWENSKSCVVLTGTGNTAPNGYAYCATTSSDADGDGWGWENSKSCVVHGSNADH